MSGIHDESEAACLLCGKDVDYAVLYLFNHYNGTKDVECAAILCEPCSNEARESPYVTNVLLYAKMEAFDNG